MGDLSTKIRGFFITGERWKGFVALAAFLPVVMVYVLESLMVFAKHMPISVVSHGIIMSVTCLISFLFLLLAALTSMGESVLSDKVLRKGVIFDISLRILVYAILMALMFFASLLGLTLVVISPIAYLALILVLLIICVVVCICMGSWLDIILFMFTGLSIYVSSMDMHYYLIGVAVRIVLAIVISLILTRDIKRYGQKKAPLTNSEDEENKSNKRNKKALIPVCLLIVGIIVSQLILPITSKRNLTKIMNDAIEKGRDFASFDKVPETIGEYRKARAYYDVMQALLDDDEEMLENLYANNSDDDYITGIYFADKKEFNELESAYLLGNITRNKAFVLLDGYNRKNRLSDNQKLYMKAITRLCVNENWLIDSDNMIETAYLNMDDAKDALKEVEDNLRYVDVLENIALAYEYRYEEPSEDVVKQAAIAANENPEDIIYQLAFLMYSNVTNDYEKDIAEAAKRYYALVCDSDRDKENRLEAAKYACGILLAQEDFNGVVQIAEDCRETIADEELNYQLLRAYTGNEDSNYSAVAALAKELIEDNPENPLYVYYAAINLWSMKEYKESIEYSLKLCEAVEDADEADKEELFNDINDIVTRMTYENMNGGTRYKMYEHRVIELDEECQKLIDSNKLFKNYWSALVKIYTNGDMDEALKELAAVDEIVPNMPMVSMQKANALYTLGKYDEALPLYQNYIDANPYDVTVRRAMANCYLSLEDYDNAKLKCQEILDIYDLGMGLGGLYEPDDWAREKLDMINSMEGEQ